jgi:hypothetical protein
LGSYIPEESDSKKQQLPKEWPKQFDVIVGNPPYNSGGIKSSTGTQLGEKNETIWPKFIKESFKLLKPDGYLVFINPLSWLKKSHSFHNILLEKHIIWMKLWNDSKSKEEINADIPLSLYVLHNILNINREKTEVECDMKRQQLTLKSNEYLDKRFSIPTAYHGIFNKLIHFIQSKNLQLEYSTRTVKSIGDKTKIQSVYKLDDMLAVDTYTVKDGIMTKKAIEIHPDANKRKLIIANKASFVGAFIDNGKLSLTGNHKFYILGKNLEVLKKMFGYKLLDIIANYTKYGQNFLDSEAFSYIPDIRKLGIDNINETQFYKLIGLTESEITQIMTGQTNSVSNTNISSSVTYNGGNKSLAFSKVDKLDYILNNVYKVNISYEKFESKLVQLGVLMKYIPKLWQKFYINKK